MAGKPIIVDGRVVGVEIVDECGAQVAEIPTPNADGSWGFNASDVAGVIDIVYLTQMKVAGFQ
jgi:hypothetical protein